MKIGKTVLKGCIPVLAVVAILVVVSAKSSSQNLPNAIIGDYCFNINGFSDTWHWRVDDLGNDIYQISGFDYVYTGSAIVGSAHRVGKNFYAVMLLSNPGYECHLIYNVILNLTTYTGTCDITLEYTNGTILTWYDSIPFSMVACPTSDSITGQGISLVEDALMKK